MDYVVFFIAGLAIGSFLNVCIYRIPRSVSTLLPSSHCPSCKNPIRAWDNVPVLSFFILKGKCRHCGSPIHWRYPIVELLGGLLFLVNYITFGLSFELFFFYAFCCALLVVAFIDLEFQIIPNSISISFIPIGLVGSLFSELGVISSLAGVLVGGGSLVLVAYLYLRITHVSGMGGGDVKLAAMIGAFLGWKGILLVIFLASLGGSIAGLVLMLVFRAGRRTPIPFGSFLAPAGILILFYGNRIVEQYFAVARAGH